MQKELTIYKSYGVMSAILDFLHPMQTLKMQDCCQWMYYKGIARIQTSISKCLSRASAFFLICEPRLCLFELRDSGMGDERRVFEWPITSEKSIDATARFVTANGSNYVIGGRSL